METRPKYSRLIAALLIFAFPFVLLGCQYTPEERLQRKALEDYAVRLFDIDMVLANKYRLEKPRPEYTGYNLRPAFYVDQAYFSKNSRLRELISEEALAQISATNQKFSLPLWMVLKVKGKELGRVVKIKRVDRVSVEDLEYATRPRDGAGVKVHAIVGLDTGKEQEVVFRFDIHLVKGETKSRPYLVDEAIFTLDPWSINLGRKGIFTDWYTPPEFLK